MRPNFFHNFAAPFRKSDLLMNLSLSLLRCMTVTVVNYAFKENWKSTAGCAPVSF